MKDHEAKGILWVMIKDLEANNRWTCCIWPLVVEDPEVARDDFVLQDGVGRDVDPVTVVGDNDDGSLQKQIKL